MTLDHDTGDMDGEIREGPLKGRLLSSLNREDLGPLWSLCQVDADSQRVLSAWVERTHPEWIGDHTAESDTPATGSGQLSEQEALEILGLPEGATKQDIVSAHRRLMQKLHPDHGGSTWMAAKLNEAKDFLLG